MSNHEQTPQQYLHDLGEHDAVFGSVSGGEFDTRTPEEILSDNLSILAEAAHDQIFGQGQQGYMTATGEDIDYTRGIAFVKDKDTNTSYRITCGDDGDIMSLRIQAASPKKDSADEPGFHRSHDIRLTYNSKTKRVTDDFMSATRFKGPLSTAALDAKHPEAFLAMAASLQRSEQTSKRKFARAESIALQESGSDLADERASGLGRIAAMFS